MRPAASRFRTLCLGREVLPATYQETADHLRNFLSGFNCTGNKSKNIQGQEWYWKGLARGIDTPQFCQNDGFAEVSRSIQHITSTQQTTV